jgi:hypothetical protein
MYGNADERHAVPACAEQFARLTKRSDAGGHDLLTVPKTGSVMPFLRPEGPSCAVLVE